VTRGRQLGVWVASTREDKARLSGFSPSITLRWPARPPQGTTGYPGGLGGRPGPGARRGVQGEEEHERLLAELRIILEEGAQTLSPSNGSCTMTNDDCRRTLNVGWSNCERSTTWLTDDEDNHYALINTGGGVRLEICILRERLGPARRTYRPRRRRVRGPSTAVATAGTPGSATSPASTSTRTAP
jgi:hypothetical protein